MSGQASANETTSFTAKQDTVVGQENTSQDYTRITLSQSIQPFGKYRSMLPSPPPASMKPMKEQFLCWTADVPEKKKESVTDSYKLVEQRVLASFKKLQDELEKRKEQLIDQAKADLDVQLKLIAAQEKSAIATETPKVQRRTSSRRKVKKLNESEAALPATIDRIHPDLFEHNEVTWRQKVGNIERTG